MIDPKERAILLIVRPTRYEVLQTKRFWFWIKGRFMHGWTSIGWGAWRCLEGRLEENQSVAGSRRWRIALPNYSRSTLP